MGNQISLGARPSLTTYSLAFSELHFLICRVGTVSVPAWSVQVRDSTI